MKAKIKTYYLLAVLILISTFVKAQTLDEIIAKHIEAHGGQENWNKVETLKYSGTFTGFSIQKKFTQIQKKPDLYQWDGGIGKFDVTLAYDGHQGWTIDPWFDVTFPRILNTYEENVVKQKAEICSPFLDYQQKGHKVEFIGKVEIDGMDMWHLKLTRKNGNEENWFLNADSYLEYKYTSPWDDFGYPTNQETYFDDFREVEGLILPFYIDRSYSIRNRVTEIETIEVNPRIKDEVFKLPLSTEMKELDFIAGKWAVEVMAQSRRGWYRSDSVTTTIEMISNLLQTKVSYENYIRYNKQYSWSYNSESGSYRFAEFNSFTSNLIISESNGFTADTLSFDNLNINFANNDKKGFRRYNIIKNSDNKFMIECARSSDEGKNWDINEKLVFTRIE